MAAARWHYTPDDRLVALEVSANENSKRLNRVIDLLDGPNGLMVRLDRMEQQGKWARWFNRALIVAVVGMLATTALPKVIALFATAPSLTP